MNQVKSKKAGIIVMMLSALTILSLFFAKNVSAAIVSNNVAGTYTQYATKTYIDWSTGGMILENKLKYVYTTTTRTVSTKTTQTQVYSYQGPTAATRSVTITEGLSRTTSVGASAEYSIFKLSAAHNITASSSKSVSMQFTFPGDNKKHILYNLDTATTKDGYVSRTAYRATVKSYKYIWGVCAWDIQYNSYQRYTTDDYAARKACTTTEHVYGNKMT